MVGVSAAPEKWRYSSDVQWNYGNVSNPVTISQRFENPANSEAVYGYPALLLFYLRPGGSYYKPRPELWRINFFRSYVALGVDGNLYPASAGQYSEVAVPGK